MTKLPSDYEAKVYAGWVGKCVGVRFGAPLENWTYEDIRDHLGELTGYVHEDSGKIFKPDDDTSVPMVLIRALEDYGLDPSAEQMGETYLNYVGDGHGTFWWGGYGVSCEHTAYYNLSAGIPAPRSGSIAQNGAALAEQIGGQIFSDIWGLVAPNNPARAAELAERAASISHDGNGVYGGRFVAALVSAAFSEHDPRKLMEIGLAQIPADSEYTRVMRAVMGYHEANPDDWRAAFAQLKANFGYDRYPGTVHIIPNAGVVALGLLYGGGDFARSIQVANMAGWDTDCNVGNVGAIMGVAVGIDGIDAAWREPMNDLFVTASIVGTRNILTIPQTVDLFVSMGRQMAGEPAPKTSPKRHFRYPDSTCAMEARGRLGRPIHWQRAVVEGQPALRTSIRKLGAKGEIRIYTRTYVRPGELSSNYYGGTFSPLIYPGQTATARVYLPPDAPDAIQAAVYVYDDNGKQAHQAKVVPLKPGAWQDLRFDIPPMIDACLSEVGVVLRNLERNWETGSVSLAELDWNGAANFKTTFAKERAETGGISQWTRVRGYWRIEDGAYHGSGVGLCETYTGDIEWTDTTVSAEVVPLIGVNHCLNVRVQGAMRGYAFGLAPDGTIVLYKKAGEYKQVASTPFAWTHGKTYRLTVTAQGSNFTGVVEGDDGARAEIRWTDDAPYANGMVGLSTWNGGHTAFKSFEVKPVG